VRATLEQLPDQSFETPSDVSQDVGASEYGMDHLGRLPLAGRRHLARTGAR